MKFQKEPQTILMWWAFSVIFWYFCIILSKVTSDYCPPPMPGGDILTVKISNVTESCADVPQANAKVIKQHCDPDRFIRCDTSNSSSICVCMYGRNPLGPACPIPIEGSRCKTSSFDLCSKDCNLRSVKDDTTLSCFVNNGKGICACPKNIRESNAIDLYNVKTKLCESIKVEGSPCRPVNQREYSDTGCDDRKTGLICLSNGKCQCQSGYNISDGKTKCKMLKMLGNICSPGECDNQNTGLTCSNNGTCQCQPGYTIFEGKFKCEKIKKSGDMCSSGGGCDNLQTGLTCLNNARCECQPGYMIFEGKFKCEKMKIFGDMCSPGEYCNGTGLECLGGRCSCHTKKNGYELRTKSSLIRTGTHVNWRSDLNECRWQSFGKICLIINFRGRDYHTCDEKEKLECSANKGQCICKGKLHDWSNTTGTCLIKLAHPCMDTTGKTCLSGYCDRTRKICACPEGQVFNGLQKKCFPANLGLPCPSSVICAANKSQLGYLPPTATQLELICDPQPELCSCAAGYTFIHGYCHLPSEYSDLCDPADDNCNVLSGLYCEVRNAKEPLIGFCMCKPGVSGEKFSWDKLVRNCTLKIEGEYCTSDEECATHFCNLAIERCNLNVTEVVETNLLNREFIIGANILNFFPSLIIFKSLFKIF